MKLSILSIVAASIVTTCAAFPTPIPDSTHVPVSQEPSLPKPFPFDMVAEVKDPSPSRPFPKYASEEGSGLEERDPSALSRFPADGDKEASDPSPPRPFPVGHPVDVSPPLEERAPSMPHMLVKVGTATTDPSPPRPFPKYPLDGDNRLDYGTPLEEREPLSRFPTDGNQEAADPSPPRPFPAGPVVEVKHHGEGHNVGAGASDPSPPRPFPAGRLVEVKPASPNNTLSARSPSPLLRTVNGSAAEASDPSPPRPFPAGHAVDVEPRGEMASPSRAHGGYFPPSNPPVERAVPVPGDDRVDADLIKPCPHKCRAHIVECCYGLPSFTMKPSVDLSRTPHAYRKPSHKLSASSSSSLQGGHGPWRTVYTSARSSAASTSTSTSMASTSSSSSSVISTSTSTATITSTLTSTLTSTSTSTSTATSTSTPTPTLTLTSTSTSTSTSTLTTTNTIISTSTSAPTPSTNTITTTTTSTTPSPTIHTTRHLKPTRRLYPPNHDFVTHYAAI